MVSEFIIDEINQILGQNSFKLIPTPVIQKEIKTLTASSVKKEKKDAVQTSIRIGKKLFTRNHPDYLKFTVLNETLGGYFGSRLMKNIREEKGLTYGISSQIAPMLQEGYFVIGTDVKKELASKALEEIYNELEKLQNEPVGDEELQTVKNYMIGSYSNSITTPFSLANKFKTLHFNGLSYDYYDNYMTAIQKVNAKDLMQMAKKYFDRTSFTEVLVG
jgi:predicted Zn-dependent peptidase